VTHSVKRYGMEEVESWYWELWNEPDIGYWRGTAKQEVKKESQKQNEAEDNMETPKTSKKRIKKQGQSV